MQASPRDQSLPPKGNMKNKAVERDCIRWPTAMLPDWYHCAEAQLLIPPAAISIDSNGWCLYCTLYPDYACFSDPILLMPWRLPKHHPKHPAAKMPVLLGRKVVKGTYHCHGKQIKWFPHQTPLAHQWRVSKVKPLSQGRRPLLLAFHLKP